MTPEQLNAQILENATPWWLKAIAVLSVVALLVIIVCLPIIAANTWRPRAKQRPLTADEIRLIELRKRRGEVI